jgi:hypothetical protein
MCDHRNYRNKINHLPPLQWRILELKTMYRYLKERGKIKGEHRKNRLWRKKHHVPLQPKSERRSKDISHHPVDQILGDISKGVNTRSRIANFCEHYSFVSSIEPFRVEEALQDPDWVLAMQEELNNFKRNEV